jgi:hypothetical protein
MVEQQQVTFANDIAEAFTNLASATAADCSTPAALVATSQDLTNQLATKDKIINDLRLALSNSNNNNANTNRRNPRSQHGGGLPNNKNYCWTHGYVITDDHISTTCTTTDPNHKREATRANPMGGSIRGKDRVPT